MYKNRYSKQIYFIFLSLIVFLESCSLFNGPEKQTEYITLTGNIMTSLEYNETQSRNAFPITQSGLTYSLVASSEGKDDIQILDKASSGSFTINIPAGEWKLTATAYSGDVALLSGFANVKKDYLTVSNYSMDIVVFPTEEVISEGTGYVDLEMNVSQDSDITKCIASWKGSDGITDTQELSFSSTAHLTLNSSSLSRIPSGSYDVRFQFYKIININGVSTDYLLYDCSETIVVLKDMETSKWHDIGNAPYFTVSGSTTTFNVTKECVEKFQQTYLCVDGINGNDSTNNGSFLSPYKTIQKAVSRFMINNSGEYNYLVYVLNDISYAIGSELTDNGLISVAGTISEPLNISIKSIDDNVKVIDGNRSGVTPGRVISVGDYGNLTLENIKITGGYTTINGAGVYVSSKGNIKLKNTVLITENYSTAGGTEKKSNLYLDYDATETTQALVGFDSELSNESRIGISVGNTITSQNTPYTVTQGFGLYNKNSSPSDIFSFDEGGFIIWDEEEKEAVIVCSTGHVVVSNHQAFSLKTNKQWIEKSESNSDYSVSLIPYLDEVPMSSSQRDSIIWSLKIVDKYGGLISSSNTSTININSNASQGYYYLIAKAEYNSLVYNSASEIYFSELSPVFLLNNAPASGTYGLSKASELEQIRQWVKKGNFLENVTFIQTQDIDLNCSDAQRWTPIGNYLEDLYFAGTYDGRNYSILNFYSMDISEAYLYPALFEAVSGTIKNLTIEGRSYCASFAGFLSETGVVFNCANRAYLNCKKSYETYGGIASYSMGKIQKCDNYGDINDAGISGGYVGGICGTNFGIIGGSEENKCTNYGNISVSKNIYVGGIAGYTYGEVSYCDNKASIFNSSSTSYGGGIIGESNSPLISHCTNYANGSFCGGIVAQNNYSRNYENVEEKDRYYIKGSVITNCINKGNSNCSNAGGIVGESDDSITIINCVNTGTLDSSYAGGIIWKLNNTYANFHNPCIYSIINCINNGNINGSGRAGGILSHFETSSSSDSYVKLLVNGCVNNGTVKSDTSSNGKYGAAGGIAAVVEYCTYRSGDIASFINNTNNGDITALNKGNAAGIVSYIKGYKDQNIYFVNNNLNTGNIEGNVGTAGILIQNGNYKINCNNNVNTGTVKSREVTNAGGISTENSKLNLQYNYYLADKVYVGEANTYYGLGAAADQSGITDGFICNGSLCSLTTGISINENAASNDLKTLLNYWVSDSNTSEGESKYASWDYDENGLPVLVAE